MYRVKPYFTILSDTGGLLTGDTHIERFETQKDALEVAVDLVHNTEIPNNRRVLVVEVTPISKVERTTLTENLSWD